MLAPIQSLPPSYVDNYVVNTIKDRFVEMNRAQNKKRGNEGVHKSKGWFSSFDEGLQGLFG